MPDWPVMEILPPALIALVTNTPIFPPVAAAFKVTLPVPLAVMPVMLLTEPTVKEPVVKISTLPLAVVWDATVTELASVTY